MAELHFSIGDFRHAESETPETANRQTEAKMCVKACEEHLERGEFEKALASAEQSRLIFEELDDRAGQTQALLSAAEAYLRQLVAPDTVAAPEMFTSILESALETAGEALCYSREDGNGQETLGKALYVFAQVEALADRGQEAIGDLKEAIEVFREIADFRAETACLVILGSVHLRLGSMSEAQQAGRDAKAVSYQVGDKDGEVMADALLHQCYSQDGAISAAATDHGGPKALPSSAAGLVDVGAVKPKDTADTLVKQKIPREAIDFSTKTDLEIVALKLEQSLEDLGLVDIEHDVPLMQAGVSSVHVMKMRTNLLTEFRGVDIPATMIFDYPSINEMAQVIVERMPASKAS